MTVLADSAVIVCDDSRRKKKGQAQEEIALAIRSTAAAGDAQHEKLWEMFDKFHQREHIGA